MITAHLPAGYVLAQGLNATALLPLAVVLAGSVFPDVDLLWMYGFDTDMAHHHRYWLHAPVFWVIGAAVLLPVLAPVSRRLASLALLFVAAVLLHLVLDTVAGGIMWLWPLTDRLFVLVRVPADKAHWLIPFLTHWTILFEVALWALAIGLVLRRGLSR